MPDHQPLRGADRVNDELEVGFDERFEKRFHRLELAGRTFLVLFVLFALSGLLGRGPFSHETRAAEGRAAVDYEPVARYDTPTQVTLHLRPAPGQQAMRVVIATSFVEPMGLQTVQPLPVSSATDKDGIAMVFALQPADGDSLVRLHLKPTVVGSIALSARVGDDPPLQWSQVVLP